MLSSNGSGREIYETTMLRKSSGNRSPLGRPFPDPVVAARSLALLGKNPSPSTSMPMTSVHSFEILEP